MERLNERDRRIRELEERLTRLSEAGLRITEDLDFTTVLQGVVDSARSLTSSRYGAITVLWRGWASVGLLRLRTDQGGAPGLVGHARGAGILRVSQRA